MSNLKHCSIDGHIFCQKGSEEKKNCLNYTGFNN